MHERLLASLESVADVRLVAALRHERLGFPNGKDLRVFIGDVHLISEKRLIEGEFTYATNHPKLLTSVVAALAELRSQAAQDETVEVYQLGDFLDLWREAPRPDQQPDVPARIKDDHEDLITAFLDRRLRAHFLLGNHDLDLYQWPDYAGWERRYYLPDAAPGVIVLHGDYFDWVERLPASIKEIFVYLFAPRVAANDYMLGRMRALSLQSHAGRDYRRQIRLAQAAPIGPLRAPRADGIPAEWNVQREGCRRYRQSPVSGFRVPGVPQGQPGIRVESEGGGDRPHSPCEDCGARGRRRWPVHAHRLRRVDRKLPGPGWRRFLAERADRRSFRRRGAHLSACAEANYAEGCCSGRGLKEKNPPTFSHSNVEKFLSRYERIET